MIVEIDRKTDEIVVYDHDGMGRKELYRSTDAAAAISWALGTFLLLIIVAPIYLYHRAYGNKRSTSSYTPNAGFYMQCPKCHSTKISSMPTGYPTHYQGFTYRHQCLDCGNVWGT